MNNIPAWSLGISLTGTRLESAHSVTYDQFEPGIADEAQAYEHRLELLMTAFALNSTLRLSQPWALAAVVKLPIRTTQSNVQFVGNDGLILPGFSSIHHGNSMIAGPGDLFTGLRKVWRLQDWQMAANLEVGVRWPTGNIEPNPFELGRQGLKHEHIFFGNGTIDPEAGLSLSKRFDSFNMYSWGRLREPLYENRYQYQAGRTISAGLGMALPIPDSTWTIFAQSELDSQATPQWRIDETKRDSVNSGRDTLSIAAGTEVRLTEFQSLNASVKIPLYTHSRGGKIDIPWFVTVGYEYRSYDSKTDPPSGSAE